MAYIGRGLDKLSNVDVLDAITFTDSAGPYNITKSSTAFIPSAIQNLLIEVDGVIQASASYTISGSTITFGVSMSSSSTMNSFIHFGMGVTMTPADGTVSTIKVVDGAVTNVKLGTDISADKLVAGTVTDARLPTTMAGKTLTTANVSATTLTAAGDGSSADGKITLNCSQNTHGVKIQSPSHASAQTYTLTLPTTAPIADRILQTDGSGNLSFAEVSGGTSWQTVVTASTLTAVAGNGYPINTTSNACTVTLPASASVGDTIEFTDYARNWGTNAVTINPNSLKFQGNTTPQPVYDTNGESISITYMDATKGWIPTNDGTVSLETPQWSGTSYYLVVAGGGSGGRERGGAGGAGGYRTNYGGSAYTLGTGITYTITVGTGGAATTTNGAGNDGLNSAFTGSDITDITSTGGGYGDGTTIVGGGDGGSGGGGNDGASGGDGNEGGYTPVEGYAGGTGSSSASLYGSGGGGGASEVGENGTGSAAGDGGDGVSNSITGSAITYAGGGGGGIYNSIANIGVGGAGGGGNGGSGGNGSNNQAATAGTDALGGGGGGSARCGSYCSDSGKGGDGVVIIRMSTADYGVLTNITGTYTATVTGSDTYIKWTASGTLVI